MQEEKDILGEIIAKFPDGECLLKFEVFLHLIEQGQSNLGSDRGKFIDVDSVDVEDEASTAGIEELDYATSRQSEPAFPTMIKPSSLTEQQLLHMVILDIERTTYSDEATSTYFDIQPIRPGFPMVTHLLDQTSSSKLRRSCRKNK